MNKIIEILNKMSKELQELDDIKSEIGMGGLMVFACIPKEEGKISQHCITLGQGSSLVATLAVVIRENPEILPLFKRAVESAPMASLLGDLPPELLEELAKDLGSILN